MNRHCKRTLRSLGAFLSIAGLCALAPTAGSIPAKPLLLRNAVAHEAIVVDASPPLAALLTEVSVPFGPRAMHAPIKPKLRQLAESTPLQAALQDGAAVARPQTASPAGPPISAAIGQSFEGVGQTDGVLDCPRVALQSVVPPDTNAAVGDTQVVQWVNTCYAVFRKSDGHLIAGPFAGSHFWKGFGGPCEHNNDGDPIIQYDKAHHRWVASQNVFNGPPFYTCVAVSKTEDALGGYFRYAFPQQPGFPDYPKWGLTPAAYYQTQNVFDPVSSAFLGVNVCAYQTDLMLTGDRAAAQVCIFDNSNGTLFDDSMLPADDDSAGRNDDPESERPAPEVLLGAIDNFFPGGHTVYEFVFTVDFEDPSQSTLAGVAGSMPIAVPPYILALCLAGTSISTYCVPQPSPGELLDTLGDRLMYRLARIVDRNGKQHFLVNHSVKDTAAVAARWYEFRAREGSLGLSLYQSGQTLDDGHYRWMGSIAMDRMGDIAIGYSRSSSKRGDYPSIYYAGQRAGEPRGTTDAEALIKKGGGSQLKSFNRWGDYSSMALDGADLCTFWYTNEYYPVSGSFAWDTWIASLRFRHCREED